MRISDWSSDVCSSDLVRAVEVEHADQPAIRDDRHDEFAAAVGIAGDMAGKGEDVRHPLGFANPRRGAANAPGEAGAEGRKDRGEGKSGAVRGAIGGWRRLTKNRKKKQTSEQKD